MSVRAHIFVSGRVQGVFYRSNAQRVALQLGLTGWVRNLHDGRVEAVVEGGEEAVERFTEWCRRGPPAAMVDRVEVERGRATGEFKTFGVRM